LAYATSTYKTDIWRLELNGPGRAAAPPKVLIDSTRLDHDQEYSLDGKRIAFTSNRSGSYEIWVCNSDGSGAMQLTTLGGSLFTAGPHWSPDGRLILFRSNPEGDAETFVIDSDGGKPKLLFPNTGVSSWSHDGKWIYFAAKGQVWKRPWPPLGQDEEAIQITRKGGGFSRESPDGRVLYYAKGDEDITSLWKVPVEGGEETQVLESVCWLNFAVVNAGIYFIPDWPPGEKPSIQYLSFATGRAATIATLSDLPGWGFSVSPDGRSLLYSQQQPREGDLWIVENFR
jgi:Tol biopolymer transport system component